MNKNAANIYRFTLPDSIGQGLTGLTPTVTIAKDSATTFSATTNSATEVNSTDAPGLYEIQFTASECNCNLLTIRVTLATGQAPAILDVVEMQGSRGATPEEIWGYTGGRTVDNTIPTVNDIWGRQAGDTTSRTITNTIPSAADNATAVWSAQTKEVTINSTQAETFATAAALATVGDNVSAVKAKTDNLPSSPAAVGSAMTLTSATVASIKSGLATGDNIEAALGALEMYGDVNWLTADVSGLSTFEPTTNTVLIDATQAATMVTATGFATPSDIPSAENIWEYPTRTITDSPDIQAELTTYGAAKTSDIPTSEDIWTYPTRELTSEIVVGISAENIADITDSVWNAPDRTMTDLTPKPNQKSIVCTSSDVINSYGIPRLENWTNETSGTSAFDEKINTYIGLAKEKMATDLNNHINSAINYIGADNMTELCAWLTGYNLYSDDESTDTDSLPETRYNMYLEQIHRIMENI